MIRPRSDQQGMINFTPMSISSNPQPGVRSGRPLVKLTATITDNACWTTSKDTDNKSRKSVKWEVTAFAEHIRNSDGEDQKIRQSRCPLVIENDLVAKYGNALQLTVDVL